MRFVVQRVLTAAVELPETQEVRRIEHGLLIYVGISTKSSETYKESISRFVSKLPHLRIFSDDNKKLANSLTEINGQVLLISNFTLRGRNNKGTALDFSHAADFETAKTIYADLVHALKAANVSVVTGEFGARMIVHSSVDGPVNIVRDL